MDKKLVEKFYIDDNAYPFSLEDYPIVDEEHGFDLRETYALDQTMLVWFYRRLRYYLSQKVVDLDFHKFDIDGEVLTEKQCIERMMDDILVYLYDFLDFVDETEFMRMEANTLVKKAMEESDAKINAAKDFGKILGIVLPTLWW